jgi:hypothetical protein
MLAQVLIWPLNMPDTTRTTRTSPAFPAISTIFATPQSPPRNSTSNNSTHVRIGSGNIPVRMRLNYTQNPRQGHVLVLEDRHARNLLSAAQRPATDGNEAHVPPAVLGGSSATVQRHAGAEGEEARDLHPGCLREEQEKRNREEQDRLPNTVT